MDHVASSKPKIVVVGAGIIGACIAWRLSAAGATVTLIDGRGPGGIASACSFGWINATYGNPRTYFDLRVASMNEWDALAAKFENLPYKKSGTLYAHFDRVDLPTFQKAHAQWGYAIDWIDREHIKKLEPNLVSIPERCLLAQDEGVLQVESAARFFVDQFRNNGGHFLQQNVKSFLEHQGKVTGVEVLDKEIEADHVVVAAGTATQSLVAGIGINIPMTSPAGLLVHTKPYEPIINRTVLTNGLHIQQRPDGSLLAGTDFGGGQMNEDPENSSAELIHRIRRAFHSANGVEFDHYTLGYRPTPEDGMPVIGAVSEAPGLYVATMHSGATLAPIVGRFVCDELLSDTKIEMLEPFRPSRFTESKPVEAERS